MNWLSYIQDSPKQPSATIRRAVAGGGSVNYTGFDVASGRFQRHREDLGQITRLSSSPIVYERQRTDGTIERYQHSDGALSGQRRVFLSTIIDPTGHRVELSYDDFMRLTHITDALGQQTQFAYDDLEDERRITGIVDPFGRTVRIDYDEQGRLQQITDPIGIQSHFTYDQGDFITRLKTPYGETQFAFGQSGTTRWLTATDPLGKTERVEFRHNANGLPFSSPIVPSINTFNKYLNSRNTYYWNKQTYQDFGPDVQKARIKHWLHKGSTTSGVLESRKQPLENRVWYNYPNQAALPTYVRNIHTEQPSQTGRVLDNGATQRTQNSYNTLGKLTQTTDPLGYITHRTYADNGIDLIRITQQRNGTTETVASYRYNDRHQITQATDANGNTTEYGYNDAGQRIESLNARQQKTQYQYNAQGYLIEIQRANGKTDRFDYDETGRISASTDTQGHTQKFHYDALDRITQIDYEDGSNLEYTWDKLDLIQSQDRQGRITQYEYDAMRHLSQTTDALNRVTHYRYNADGHRIAVTDPEGHTTQFDYDIQGRLSGSISPDNHRTRYQYQAAQSLLETITDPAGGITKYTYDLANQRIGITDPNQNTTHYAYDEAANVITQTSPDTGVSSYTYDAVGNKTSATDANGVRTEILYDALNRITDIHYADADENIKIDYDGDNYPNDNKHTATGQRTGLQTATSDTTWRYNEYGDLIQQQTTFLELGKTYSHDFTYDYSYQPNNGRMTQQIYPDGMALNYQYNKHGRINQIDKLTNTRSVPLLSNIDYLLLGGIKSQTYGNGIRLERQIDKNSRLQRQTLQGETTQSDLQWRYSANGNIQEITDHVFPDKTKTYEYDRIDRLTQSSYPDTQAFEYDANSNRTQMVRNDTVTDYQIKIDNNQMIERIGSEAISFDYDLVGNTTAERSLNEDTTYTYTARNQLQTIETNGQKIAAYAYNGLSQRMRKSTADKTEYYLYTPAGQVMAELDETGEITKQYLYFNAQPLALVMPSKQQQPRKKFKHGPFARIKQRLQDRHQRRHDKTDESPHRFWPRHHKTTGHGHRFHHRDEGDETDEANGAVYYYHNDHLGTPQRLTDEDQSVVWEGVYSPFGEVSLVVDEVENNLRFSGQYADRESGLHYNYFRYYNSIIGRYDQHDPIGLEGGLNGYLYANANPLRYIDPLGLIVCKCAARQTGARVNNGKICTYYCSCVDCGNIEIKVSAGSSDSALCRGQADWGPPAYKQTFDNFEVDTESWWDQWWWDDFVDEVEKQCPGCEKEDN